MKIKLSFLTECFKPDARSIMRKKQSTYKHKYWDIINNYTIQAKVSVLNDLKMCLDGIGKIKGFITNEILTIYNYTSSS